MERVVNPLTSMSPLLCYFNCPDTTQMSNCQDDACYRAKPSRLSNTIQISEKAAQCTSNDVSPSFPSWTFANIGGNPSLNVTWRNLGLSNGKYQWEPTILMGDVGMTCTSDPESEAPTVTFDDSTAGIECVTDPEVTLSCVEGSDTIDFRQAYSYSFDSNSGIMTDNTDNAQVLFPTDSTYMQYGNSLRFGPFFDDDSEKTKLACPDNTDFVCMRNAEKVLDTIYYYYAGDGKKRAVLTNPDDGQPLNFATEKVLMYTHTGDTSNSGKNYDGSTQILTFAGPRQLYGLPEFCLDAKTGQSTDVCWPPGNPNSADFGSDINIEDGTILTDSYGVKYYAKALSISELYPITSETSICDGLDISTFDLEAPNLDTIFVPPTRMCDSFPTQEDLKDMYLNEGVPAVIGGTTQNELAANTV